MNYIDVHDLPEPLVRAITIMIEALRQQLGQAGPKKESRDLPCWEGEVRGSLTREEIYDDGR